MKTIKPKRVSDSSEFLVQGNTKGRVEPWSKSATDSFLRKEFFKVFKKNQDNQVIYPLFD